MPKFLLRALLLVLIVVGPAACGGGDEDPGDTSDIKKYDRSQTARKLAESEPEDVDIYAYDEEEETGEEAETNVRGFITAASLSPETLRADSTITIKTKTAAPLNDNQALTYKYWKNGQPMEETKENQLSPLSFKKHDVFFADVMLKEADQLIARKRTGMKPVLNSPPMIEKVTMPDIQGPGTYEFIVTAKDIDDDQITFSLEADDLPVEMDARIDPGTGTVTCTLDDNPPESIKFIIAADDGDRGVTKKIVSVRFFRRPVKEE
jgi:hypothetical protein